MATSAAAQPGSAPPAKAPPLEPPLLELPLLEPPLLEPPLLKPPLVPPLSDLPPVPPVKPPELSSDEPLLLPTIPELEQPATSSAAADAAAAKMGMR